MSKITQFLGCILLLIFSFPAYARYFSLCFFFSRDTHKKPLSLMSLILRCPKKTPKSYKKNPLFSQSILSLLKLGLGFPLPARAFDSNMADIFDDENESDQTVTMDEYIERIEAQELVKEVPLLRSRLVFFIV